MRIAGFGDSLKIISLFFAMLGLHGYTSFFSSCDGWRLLSSGAQASHCGFSCGRARALGLTGFNSWGAQASLTCGMWNLPESGVETTSLALAGRFSSTQPPGKSQRGIVLRCFRPCPAGLPHSFSSCAPSLLSGSPLLGLSESFSHPRRELMPSLQASDLGVVGSDTPRNG